MSILWLVAALALAVAVYLLMLALELWTHRP